MEGLDGQKPMLVLPQKTPDQNYHCELVELKRIGQCLTSVSVEELDKKVKIIEQNNFYRDEMRQVKKILDKKRSDP